MDFPIEYNLIIVGIIVCLFLHRKNAIVLYPLLFYMSYVAVFRGENVGTDYYNYIDMFNYITSENVIAYAAIKRVELGFLYEIIFFKMFINNPNVFYGIQFLIFFGGFCYYCRYKKADMGWALFLFFMIGFYFRSFNTIRQFVVIGLMLFCMPLLDEKKYLKYIALNIFISVLFHLSGIVFLFLFLVKYLEERRKLNSKLLLGGLLISTYLLFFVNHSFLYNVNLFGFMGEKFNHYFTTGADREEVGNLTATVYTIYALFVLYCSDFKKYKYMVTCYVFSIMIFNILNLVNVHASRLALGIMILICPLASQLIKDKNTKYRYAFTISTVVIGAAMFISQFVINNASEVKPYYSIF